MSSQVVVKGNRPLENFKEEVKKKNKKNVKCALFTIVTLDSSPQLDRHLQMFYNFLHSVHNFLQTWPFSSMWLVFPIKNCRIIAFPDTVCTSLSLL